MTVSGVNVFRLASGRIAEIWNHRDDLMSDSPVWKLPDEFGYQEL